jgi:phenylpropionate dioxygenase-like ring-hydroxylating dioxygenase large terminal subunit
VYEDINRHKTDECANLLLTAVRHGLKQGFNPFEQAKEAIVEFQQQAEQQAEPQQQPVPEKTWSYIEAFNYFIQEWVQSKTPLSVN